jgi:hypothetical protein
MNSENKDFHMWNKKFAIIHLFYPLANMSHPTFLNKMMKHLKFISLIHGG